MGRDKGQGDYPGYGRRQKDFSEPHVKLLLYVVGVQIVLHILCSFSQGLYYF
jgi:hypothetical protein